MHIPVRHCSWTHWIVVELTPSPAAVPRLTKTKLKYRNETEIPERKIKIIGKHLQVYRYDVDLPKRPLNNNTVRPPRRFDEFRTRVMRENAGKGLKTTENPCETPASITRNPCDVSRSTRSSRKIGKIRAGIFTNFHAKRWEIISLVGRSTKYCLSLWWIEKKRTMKDN